jgi:hypothetical protein
MTSRTSRIARGGKGSELVKRAGLERVVPVVASPVNWDDLDQNQLFEQPPESPKPPSRGQGRLFDEDSDR